VNDILLIEDDEGIIKLLQVHLREPAFRLTSCMGGIEGLAVFKAQNFHLVLLDINLPDIDGMEVYKDIRKKSDNVPLSCLRPA